MDVIATGAANKAKKIANEVAQELHNLEADISDNTAVDIVETLDNNFVTAAQLAEIDTIKDKAEKVHTHSADAVIETANKVFITPAEKAKIASTETALAGKASAVHNHSAADITETSDRLFVTPAEKAKWNNITTVYVVADNTAKTSIPTPAIGSRCMVRDDGDGKFAGYWYDGSIWLKDSDPDWVNVSISWADILNKPNLVLQSDIGILSSLQTNDKTSIVAAINELNTKTEAAGGGSSMMQLNKPGVGVGSSFTIDMGDTKNQIVMQVWKAVINADAVTAPAAPNSNNAGVYSYDPTYLILSAGGASLINSVDCNITKQSDYISGLVMKYKSAPIDISSYKSVTSVVEV